MEQTLHAIYDGEVFRPEKQLSLKPNIRVRLTVETSQEEKQKKRSFLQTARSLKIEGPPDWSAHLEDYLYRRGTLVHE